MSETINISPDKYKNFIYQVLIKAGCTTEDATIIAKVMLWTDLRGRSGHGAFRLPTLIKRLKAGILKSPATLNFIESSQAAHKLDAGNAFGQVAATAAIDRAIQLAQKFGIGMVVVSQSNHYGAAAYYINRAVESGCIALTGTNSIPRVAPPGSRKPLLGTNPLGFGCPTANGPPLLVDFSTSAISGANIIKASKESGSQIPEGLALDSEGKPTTDPSQVAKGALLPAGGPKGFCIGLLVEILSSMLSGSAMSKEVGSMYNTWDRGTNVGHFFIVIDIKQFINQSEFLERIATLIEWMKAFPQNPDIAIRYPGEGREKCVNEFKDKGIPLSAIEFQEFQNLADEFAIDFP